MGKRKRRERDRPKAGPEAAYNPNKRTLLSYAGSDEEDVPDGVAGTGHPAAADAVPADYIIAPYPDEDDICDHESAGVQEDATGPDGLLADQRSEPEDEEEVAGPPPRIDSRLRANPVTGQRPALGALVYEQDYYSENGGADYDSEEAEAMAYLKAVR